MPSHDPDVESFAVVETLNAVGRAYTESGARGPLPEQGACQRLLCDASTVITIQLTPHEQEQLKQLKVGVKPLVLYTRDYEATRFICLYTDEL